MTLKLSSSDKKIAGVCGGLGEYFHIDPTIVRALFIFAFFVYGTGPLIYLILWLLMKENNE